MVKRIIIFFSVIIFTLPINAFYVDGIYYIQRWNQTGEPEVMVSYNPNDKGAKPSEYYKGDITIPSYITVNENGETNRYVVTEIGQRAFYKCTDLTSINFPLTLREISNDAFYGCSSLTTITIPVNVENVAGGAFMECNNLTTLNFNAKNYSLGWVDDYKHPFPTTLSQINIGSEVKVIPAEMAYECVNLQTIHLPSSVRIIEKNAFSGCTNLKSINLHDWVEEFYDGAFYNCSSLEIDHLPINTTIVSRGLFCECKSIVSFQYPNTLDYIPVGMFSRSGIKSFIVPNAVEFIGDEAFYECQDLEIVEIGCNVKKLGKRALRGCPKLGSVICHALVPPEVTFNDMLDYPHLDDGCILYVPMSSLQAYIDSDYSKFFSQIKPIEGSGIDDMVLSEPSFRCYGTTLRIQGNFDSLEIYSVDGRCVHSGNDNTVILPISGIYIVCIDGIRYKILIK